MRGYIFVDKKFIPGEVECENEIITKINLLGEDELTINEAERYIIPGLVDIHLHGCMGVDFCDCKENHPEVIERIVEYEKSVGVTSICPTTMTYDESTLFEIMKAAEKYAHERIKDGTDSRTTIENLCGIYLEGPFISKERKGAQNSQYITKPDAKMVQRLNEASGGLIRAVAVAPEVDGAIDFIREISDFSNIRCSIAHTKADYDIAAKAIASGAEHVTHLHNAMEPFLNRAPGVVGAAYDSKTTFVELICDGIHVHPSVVRATFDLFGCERVVLISDSMEATGMPDGEYSLGGQTVYKKDSRATLSDGTLAGSVTNLFDCMKMAVKMGIAKEDAIISATLSPARSIGLDNIIGRIAVGQQAKLLICDEKLNLKDVIC